MGTPNIGQLVAARAAELAYYSPYFFLPRFSGELQQALFGTGAIERWYRTLGAETYHHAASPADVYWLLHQLEWDSAYFGAPVYRLFTGLFGSQTSTTQLAQAAMALRQHLVARTKAFYAFCVVPAEDVRLLQGLTAAGWQLVETRLTYYRDQLPAFDHPRFPVRAATVEEAAHIGQIAARVRNPYDRLHADARFSDARADAYLDQYAQNTVAGNLAAVVLVPNVVGLPIDSFLAVSDLESDATALGAQLSRVLLTAVGPANRGWHVKLVAETLHRARELGHEAVLMTTQATNHAIFRSCEKLGFRLGATGHVLVCNRL